MVLMQDVHNSVSILRFIAEAACFEKGAAQCRITIWLPMKNFIANEQNFLGMFWSQRHARRNHPSLPGECRGGVPRFPCAKTVNLPLPHVLDNKRRGQHDDPNVPLRIHSRRPKPIAQQEMVTRKPGDDREHRLVRSLAANQHSEGVGIANAPVPKAARQRDRIALQTKNKIRGHAAGPGMRAEKYRKEERPRRMRGFQFAVDELSREWNPIPARRSG